MSAVALLGLLMLLAATDAQAHAVRPAYLDITERSHGRYHLTLRLPDPTAPGPLPVLPDGCDALAPPQVRTEAAGPVMTLDFDCGSDGLAGQTLGFADFPLGCREILVHLRPLEGPAHLAVVERSDPQLHIPGKGEGSKVPVGEYLTIGVEHIILGPDHLLFVLGLLLIVGLARSGDGRYPLRRLLGTVTAFTLAHSITLSLAVLGHAALPGPPVELVISLSILLLAVELSGNARQARVSDSLGARLDRESESTNNPRRELVEHSGGPSLTLRYPWAVAFLFGLLHGFGFAGALAEIGFPEDALAMALLLFNAGVELGQVAFIVAVLGLGWGLRRARLPASPLLQRGAIYVMGATASFWCWDRLWGIIG